MAILTIDDFQPTQIRGIYRHPLLGRVRISIPFEDLAARLDAEDFREIEPGIFTHDGMPGLRLYARPGQTVAEVFAEFDPAVRARGEPAAVADTSAVDRRMLLDATIARAAAEIAADDTADADLKAAATRELTRLAAAVR
ncbi:MAG: hypothetical protein KDJ86_00145 [Bauldia sp.]|uniref:hypothetical protein n=1 Tax=Bauldia sp. TaxID=2575872 RepID=UPI001D4AF95F|nr:hypothetical protein [Bauldia sp.]MCB1494165.1 hypothetical protein [Bauldia sp.]